MPSGRRPRSRARLVFAQAQGEGTQILAIERQDVEGAELDFVIVLARVQRIEVGDAVDAEDDSLAVDDKLLDPVLKCRFHDPWISTGPVVPVAGDRAHTIALALHPDAVAVVFDFVKPSGPRWKGSSMGRNAKIQTPLTCWEDRRFARIASLRLSEGPFAAEHKREKYPAAGYFPLAHIL